MWSCGLSPMFEIDKVGISCQLLGCCNPTWKMVVVMFCLRPLRQAVFDLFNTSVMPSWLCMLAQVAHLVLDCCLWVSWLFMTLHCSDKQFSGVYPALSKQSRGTCLVSAKLTCFIISTWKLECSTKNFVARSHPIRTVNLALLILSHCLCSSDFISLPIL